VWKGAHPPDRVDLSGSSAYRSAPFVHLPRIDQPPRSPLFTASCHCGSRHRRTGSRAVL
jgi:hypothetical protein